MTYPKDWKFCKVSRKNKTPVETGWTELDRSPEDIEDYNNIGVICGPVSGGVVCVDFDGFSTFEFWINNFGEIPNSLSWSSGTPGRMQMAFKVDAIFWQRMRTMKHKTLDKEFTDDGKSEQLEFRWTNAQSVIPPSIHTSGRKYEWVYNTEILPLPKKPMEFWLKFIQEREQRIIENSKITNDNVHLDDVKILLKLIGKGPRLDFEQWLSVVFAAAWSSDVNTAIQLLEQYMPIETKNEYTKHLEGWIHGLSPKINTLHYFAKQADEQYYNACVWKSNKTEDEVNKQQIKNLVKNSMK